jgi:hypothetical protein
MMDALLLSLEEQHEQYQQLHVTRDKEQFEMQLWKRSSLMTIPS